MTGRVNIKTADGHETVRYQKRDDGWYVQVPDTGKWTKYAVLEAEPVDVRQLIRKQFDNRY